MKLRRIAIFIMTVGISIVAVGGILHAAGARVNTSQSIPIGLYWLSDAPVEKGRYVIFCPPQTSVFEEARARGYINEGFCPGGYGPMMKKILAAKGDTVIVTTRSVTVNGEQLTNSAQLVTDKNGLPLPRMETQHTLDENELFLMTDHSATSFDGRYFGTINKNQVQAVIRPVFIW